MSDDMPGVIWVWDSALYGRRWGFDEVPESTRYIRADHDAAIRKDLAARMKNVDSTEDSIEHDRLWSDLFAYLSQPEGT